MKLSRSAKSFTRDSNFKAEMASMESDRLRNKQEGFDQQNEDF